MHHGSIASILKTGYDQYRGRYVTNTSQNKVVGEMMSCRSSARGGHEYECPHCQAHLILFNSCGNRHCPQCQYLARREWIEARTCDLLPVRYFHVVFTIPSELNPFALRNRKIFYSIMFRAVNETLQELGATSRYLGAGIGFIAVLHTWGQNLMDHPHIHCIVPAGGLSKDGKRWVSCKNNFLFPFNVMKKLFAGKLLGYFREEINNGNMSLHGSLIAHNDKSDMDKKIDKLYKCKWVIFVKQPFAGPERVIRYLGNYTHRVAISNSRIIRHEENTVSFTYKDYADNSNVKVMTLEKVEFIRRFLCHILPARFMRIRHYGFLSNSNRTRKMMDVASIFPSVAEQIVKKEKQKKEKIPWYTRMEKLTGKNPLLCNQCRKAVVALVRVIEPVPANKGFVNVMNC